MLRDQNGLTEEEFLAQYDPSIFQRPSVTVDIVLADNGKILLIRRGGHPNLGKWALPGGFVEPDETAEQAALRELEEETGVRGVAIRQLGCFSNPDRDPRTRIITIAFTAVFTDFEERTVAGGDDAIDAGWFECSVKPIKEYTSKKDNISYGIKEYQIILEAKDISLSCQIRRSTPKVPYPADPVYELFGKNDLAGDHGLIIATALDKTD